MIPRHIELLQQGKPHEAEQLLRAQLRFTPQNPALHSDMALAKLDQGNALMAETGWRYVLEYWPTHFPAAANLGDMLLKSGRIEEAETLFQERLRKNDADHESAAALAHVLIEELRIGEAIPLLKRVADQTRHPVAISEYLSYAMHAGYDADGHREFVDRFAPTFTKSKDPAAFAPKLPWDGVRQLRIGFVGNVFREHACAYVLEPILEHTKHEAVIYADNVQRDTTSERMKALMQGRWRDTGHLDHQQHAAQLRADKVDIVVDLMGHKAGNRLLSLAHHPAPTLLGYIGYPGDTLITQNIDAEVGWAYRPSDDALPIASLPFDRNSFITFGSVHRAAKLTTVVLKMWGKLMQAMPTARLLIAVAAGEKNTGARKRLVDCGLPGDRVELVDKSPSRNGYLAFANHIDIHLDTFPYAGGATTFDMLNQGVPTVTLAGGNVSGMPSFAAHSVEEYVDTCRSADPDQLRDIRRDARALIPDAVAVATAFDAVVEKRAVALPAAAACCD